MSVFSVRASYLSLCILMATNTGAYAQTDATPADPQNVSASTTTAKIPLPRYALSDLRISYQKAFTAIQQQDMTKAKSLLSNLQAYPLYPYAQAYYFNTFMQQVSAQEIESFIKEYQDLPARISLHRKWLNTLAARRDWQGYHDAYQLADIAGTHYLCLDLQAQLNLTSADTFLTSAKMQDLTSLWQVGHSQPDACDPLFKIWKEKGGLTQVVAIQRTWKAIQEGNWRLAQYASRFLPQTPQLMAKLDPKYQDLELTEWRIRFALSQQDWPQVLEHLAHLPKQEAHTDRWHYWSAVAQQKSTGAIQTKKLQALAKKRSYYGFLAAQQLGQGFHLNQHLVTWSEDSFAHLYKKPSVQRIVELIQQEEFYYARLEWNRIFPTLSKNEQHALAHLAKKYQWYTQAIIAAARLQEWDDLNLRFPIEHQDLYSKFTDLHQIPMNWALSITRQESAFNAKARSHANAKGLMQLLPKTAEQTARQFNLPFNTSVDLYQPEINIALGSAYLAKMRADFNGNRIYATAAYNAGPHRVRAWLQERGHLPLDIWIEVIPFRETRHYVQNVLEYGVVYDLLTQQKAHLFDEAELKLLALQQTGQAEKTSTQTR
ncbi:Soluble lytic murein transglycosylase [Allopseudospirillum japonicum]|uniref:Soluble lytic murein transglycosylase n=1 Tax=Allopseudospirillum japonicum TaxID=64971 RepID=A0A1H6TVV0_9GAMM|nr:transglycosylase SLT domain-containing protein [Allopseudospirillum japonicum]SEI84173.1 Soluble lytic murein transglycosylase [Allopseudospirillum japonicum]